MDADFSHRAADALDSLLFLAFSMDERNTFVQACVDADSFAKLPQKWQNLMQQTEKTGKVDGA